jgi:hypothetical protein
MLPSPERKQEPGHTTIAVQLPNMSQILDPVVLDCSYTKHPYSLLKGRSRSVSCRAAQPGSPDSVPKERYLF